MKFTVLTLFPELVDPFFQHGIIGRAVTRGLISGQCINPRDFSRDKHNTVDDRPYGGGSGMVMKPDPLSEAVHKAKAGSEQARVVLMTPQGRPFCQKTAQALASSGQDLIFVCGRYEGIDERFFVQCVDEELSMGDFVMTGGELAAMAVIDSVARLIPDVLGSSESPLYDSFAADRLEHAHYTRPENFKGLSVPGVLLSGDHEKIRQWRIRSGLLRTFLKRPDLFDSQKPSSEERQILRQWCTELEKLAADESK